MNLNVKALPASTNHKEVVFRFLRVRKRETTVLLPNIEGLLCFSNKDGHPVLSLLVNFRKLLPAQYESIRNSTQQQSGNDHVDASARLHAYLLTRRVENSLRAIVRIHQTMNGSTNPLVLHPQNTAPNIYSVIANVLLVNIILLEETSKCLQQHLVPPARFQRMCWNLCVDSAQCFEKYSQGV